ncbi:MAG TPA: hypothetical protein VFT81_05935 [Dermatophilaceae bacterium]|nr:hypothetical protein [Dermatophilaceae bacterium]
MNDPELDAEFERIISGWDEEVPDPHPQTELSRGDAGLDDATPAEPAQAPEEGPPAGPDAAAGGMTLSIAPTTSHVWRAAPTPADDVDEVLDGADPEDAHFEPPTITDLPNAEDDPMYWAIVVGLGGGPLLLFYLLIFDREGSGWWVALALAMTVVGFVLLVLRGGTERDPFDDGTRV